EAIDVVANPRRVPDVRYWRRNRSDVGPVSGARLGGGRLGGRLFGPDRALIDPRANQRDLRGRQRILVLRHLIVAVETADAADDPAVLAVAGDDDGPAVAAFERGGAEIQPQPVFGLFRAVALVTASLENWLDVANEVDRFLGRRHLLVGGRDTSHDCRDEQQRSDGSRNGRPGVDIAHYRNSFRNARIA